MLEDKISVIEQNKKLSRIFTATSLLSGGIHGFFDAYGIKIDDNIEKTLIFTPSIISGGYMFNRAITLMKDNEESNNKKFMLYNITAPVVSGAVLGGIFGAMTFVGYGIGYSIGYISKQF